MPDGYCPDGDKVKQQERCQGQCRQHENPPTEWCVAAQDGDCVGYARAPVGECAYEVEGPNLHRRYRTDGFHHRDADHDADGRCGEQIHPTLEAAQKNDPKHPDSRQY